MATFPYRRHLRSPTDLETTYEATRAGFVALALEKNRRAAPYVQEARALQAAASQARKPAELLDIEAIESCLLAAAGLSDKALVYLAPEDRDEAIKALFENYLEPAKEKFVEELVFRFLLTRGDALGGSMRNVGGVLAQRKLTRAILATLTIAGIVYRWQHSKNGHWAEMTSEDSEIEFSLRSIHWQRGDNQRTLIVNLTVPLVKNNVDLCLFNLSPKELEASKYALPESYIALGELKGGIDPAGADEHWKTARTSLERIRNSFAEAGQKPHTFFIGTAIEKKMAGEIWKELKNGSLSNAANLNVDHQLYSISRWLCTL